MADTRGRASWKIGTLCGFLLILALGACGGSDKTAAKVPSNSPVASSLATPASAEPTSAGPTEDSANAAAAASAAAKAQAVEAKAAASASASKAAQREAARIAAEQREAAEAARRASVRAESPTPAAPPAAQSFSNCTDMHGTYPHGVGRSGAVDETSGTPVTTFTRSDAIYDANSGSDRDGDGIACEKK